MLTLRKSYVPYPFIFLSPTVISPTVKLMQPILCSLRKLEAPSSNCKLPNGMLLHLFTLLIRCSPSANNMLSLRKKYALPLFFFSYFIFSFHCSLHSSFMVYFSLYFLNFPIFALLFMFHLHIHYVSPFFLFYASGNLLLLPLRKAWFLIFFFLTISCSLLRKLYMWEHKKKTGLYALFLKHSCSLFHFIVHIPFYASFHILHSIYSV